jgi:uncharacterized protein with PQ loop repeat
VRLTIAAHLELYHLTVLYELRQNIFIKFPVTQNCPGPICTTNYIKSMFSTTVMFIKIAMERKKKICHCHFTEFATLREVLWY